jgi:selenocysteine lyase/cysteine desulfurase
MGIKFFLKNSRGLAMTINRRAILLAAGSLPIQAAVLSAAAQEAGGPLGRRAPKGSPAPVLGAAPQLPDKASFPSVQNTTYLNSAGSHPWSAGSIDLIKKAALTEAEEPNGFIVNQNRIKANYAKLINADQDEIAFVPSTSIGESFVAAALGLPASGAHVVSDYLHFIGAQMMYVEMQKRGLEVTWVKMTKDGRISLEDYDRAIIPGKTKLVAVSSTSMINGFSHDLKRLCEIAHSKGALVHADIIQTVGNAPFDVKETDLDTACAGTFKWLMSHGTAFLYVKKSVLAKMQPPYYHFNNYTFPGASETPSTKMGLPNTHMYPFDTPGKEIADNFQPKDGVEGMFEMSYQPNTATLAGLEYSIPYITNIGVPKIQAHAKPLIDRLKQELPKRGYPLLTPLNNNSPIVTVVMKDAGRLDPVFEKANVKIATRWNHVRVSVSVFNDMDDVERVIAAFPANNI